MDFSLTRFLVLLIILTSSRLTIFASHSEEEDLSGQAFHFPPPTWSTPWVDSVFQSLSLEQRIAQLLMIRVHTDRDEDYYDRHEKLVKRYNLGGIAFFRGGPVRQLNMTRRLQQAAQTPLLIAMDAEWGPSMRLDSTIQFPRQMTLGAIANEDLVYEMGQEVGQQLRRLGVHINFAPVVDVNNNPDNPVINFRAFGEDRYNVARKGVAYMQGMQDAGIFACAKHFPGHGDTNADSHHTLPVINHSFSEIDSIHLYPFKELIRKGLHAVMIAHLNIPALDIRKNVASTLSETIVTGLLQEVMGFNGLVITDALDMRGVSDHFSPGELELQALLAGNDILLLPENIPAAINAIKKAITDGRLDEESLNQRCKKVLFYKQLAGLNELTLPEEENLIADLNTEHAHRLNRKLARAAITLAKNEDDLIPVQQQHLQRIAALAIGASAGSSMHNMLARYAQMPMFSIPKSHSVEQVNALKQQLKDVETVIISVHNNSFFPTRQYGINTQTITLIRQMAKEKTVILCLFANPYSLLFFEDDIADIDAVIIAYQDGQDYEDAVGQVIFGGLPARGRLPVSAGSKFPAGSGVMTAQGFRIGFAAPEDAGLSSDYLKKIDSIASNGIDSGAYPGCQIVVIKDGLVIYERSFGNHVYRNGSPVRMHDIYDLASLTKMVATTAAVMHLSDQGKINVDHHVGTYLPWLRGTNKEQITLRELMAHQARLEAWIPFYMNTLEKGNLNPFFYTHYLSDEYPIQVARNLFLHKNYRDSIFTRITLSPLKSNRDYLYSDLGFILMAEIIQNQSGMPVDEYVDKYFFKPLGLSNLCFRPLANFPLSRIIPTENDTVFRKQLLHGHVHDPAAAMLGGRSGHAGLFGNALDVAVMMQLFLQRGYYGGQQFVREETVREFTRVQFPGNRNRRGLGFDKPVLDRQNNGPTAKSASPGSFGHSGFTGTYAWADPDENLVYVFLSNRVYPTANNTRINRMSIRTNIQQVIYDAISEGRKRGKIHNN